MPERLKMAVIINIDMLSVDPAAAVLCCIDDTVDHLARAVGNDLWIHGNRVPGSGNRSGAGAFSPFPGAAGAGAVTGGAEHTQGTGSRN